MLFFKFLVDTCPFMGPLLPLFWISGDVSSGLQSQSGWPYLYLAKAYTMYILRDSPVLHLLISWWPAWWPVTVPHMCVSAEVGSQIRLGDLLHSSLTCYSLRHQQPTLKYKLGHTRSYKYAVSSVNNSSLFFWKHLLKCCWERRNTQFPLFLGGELY